jgi:hypothetical protein
MNSAFIAPAQGATVLPACIQTLKWKEETMLLPTRMITLAALLAASLAVAAPAMSQTPAKALTPQQQRMSDCNKTSAGKTGDDRKSYMSTCLKGEPAKPAKALSASQQRMKDCNATAGTQSLTGDKRKAFMSTCLKSPK